MHASKLDQNAQAFNRTARWLGDAELLRLSENGMRPLAVGGRDDCATVTGDCNAAHGRRTFPDGDPTAPCPIKPPRCDCHVIGGNTLGTAGIGVASLAGRFGTVTIDSGDAGFFVPYYMFITAFATASNTTITGVPVLVLLQDSTSGREPNMRRASTSDPSFGVATLVYGQNHPVIECVDWQRFSSVNNQQIVLTFYNPRDVAIHVFVALWGIPAAGNA